MFSQPGDPYCLMLVYQLAFKLCGSFSDPWDHASPERISPRVGQAPTPPCTASDYSCPSTLKFHLEMEDLWFSSLTLHRRTRTSLTSCILSWWRLSRYIGLKTYWSSSWLHCLVIYLIQNICREENSDKQYYIINNLLYGVAMGWLCHAPYGTGCMAWGGCAMHPVPCTPCTHIRMWTCTHVPVPCTPWHRHMRTCSIHGLYEKDLLHVGWVNIYMICRLCLSVSEVLVEKHLPMVVKDCVDWHMTGWDICKRITYATRTWNICWCPPISSPYMWTGL